MLHKARMKPADIHQTGKQAYVAQFPNSNKHLMELLSRNLDCIIFPLSQHFRQLFSPSSPKHTKESLYQIAFSLVPSSA